MQSPTVAALAMLDDDMAKAELRLNTQPITVNAWRQMFPDYGNCRDMDGDPPSKARRVAWVSP